MHVAIIYIMFFPFELNYLLRVLFFFDDSVSYDMGSYPFLMKLVWLQWKKSLKCPFHG